MITRRQLMQGTAATAAALGLPNPAPAVRRGPLPSTEEVRVAVAGIRSRGRSHIDGFKKLEGSRVVALCDVDRRVLGQRAEELEKATGDKIGTSVDLREILDRDDVDAISVATPNHWHALQAVWACQAGKDVYLEKPVSHNVWEGGQVVAAARKHGRIVQAGTQCRSSEGIAEGIAWIQAGNLGKIQVARGLCYKPRQSIGKVDGPQTVPDHIDYDLWCGPAPKVPLGRKSLHYDWHWVFDTGNGDLGNQGIHQMDLARWALGESDIAPATMSVGGRFGYDDDGNTPNTQIVFHDYPTAPLVFEVRGLPRDKASREKWGGSMDTYMGARIGVIVHCEGGHLLIPNYNSAKAFDKDGKEIQSWKGSSNHYANFLDAVRSRKVEDLNGDIREGHVSSALCHTGNASYLAGKGVHREVVLGAVRDNREAQATFTRMSQHLEKNEVHLDKVPVTLGPWIQVDPKTLRITNNERADRLMTREYRAPFVVPEEV